MSDKYLHDEGYERPSQDWQGGLASSLGGSGCSPARQKAFELIRDILEESGIPFPRANALAERCYRALSDLL